MKYLFAKFSKKYSSVFVHFKGNGLYIHTRQKTKKRAVEEIKQGLHKMIDEL